MELGARVAEALLASAESAEVLDSLWDDVVEEVEVDAGRACYRGYQHRCSVSSGNVCIDDMLGQLTRNASILLDDLAGGVDLEERPSPGHIEVGGDGHSGGRSVEGSIESWLLKRFEGFGEGGGCCSRKHHGGGSFSTEGHISTTWIITSRTPPRSLRRQAGSDEKSEAGIMHKVRSGNSDKSSPNRIAVSFHSRSTCCAAAASISSHRIAYPVERGTHADDGRVHCRWKKASEIDD